MTKQQLDRMKKDELRNCYEMITSLLLYSYNYKQYNNYPYTEESFVEEVAADKYLANYPFSLQEKKDMVKEQLQELLKSEVTNVSDGYVSVKYKDDLKESSLVKNFLGIN